MSIIYEINNKLNKYSRVKKLAKRVYQKIVYHISNKNIYIGNGKQITPKDGKEYFFGYYDKSPWNASDNKIICLRVDKSYGKTSFDDLADIVCIDIDLNAVKKIGETHSWNIQQGCMLQWLGTDYNSKIIYNDYRNGEGCAVIFDFRTGDETIIDMPVYAVSSSGRYALSLDFYRLERMRPGYGYCNREDKTKFEKIPASPCIWLIDLEDNNTKAILSYNDFFEFETRNDMIGAEHKVNHIMFSPSGNKFMVIHRWYNKGRKYSRLITYDFKSKKMYNLSDDDMVSHCCWKNDNEILAFLSKKDNGIGYYLLKDNSRKYQKYWKEINYDGHPSFSPDGNYIVFDTYPNGRRMSSVYISKSDNCDVSNLKLIFQSFSPFKYDNEYRCDLHPRWNHHNSQICVDTVCNGKRSMFVVEI